MSPGKKQTKPPGTKAQNVPALTKQKSFSEIVALIEQARQQAYQAVNTELIRLYWQIGGYISEKIESAQWGDGVVDQLAAYIAQAMPGVRGFTRRNLFRMRQFYETYAGDTKVSPLVSQLSWTNHLLIMGQCKRPEEREFYMRLSIEHRWGKRELERQLRASLFERAVLNPPKVAPAVRQMYPEAETTEEVENLSTDFKFLSKGTVSMAPEHLHQFADLFLHSLHSTDGCPNSSTVKYPLRLTKPCPVPSTKSN